MIAVWIKIAAKMADELKAAVATNPLLKATGPVLDPRSYSMVESGACFCAIQRSR